MRFFIERGGKRAVALRVWNALSVPATSLRRFATPLSPAQPIRRLVFVCAGNICRSPFAEAVACAEGLAAISMGIRADPGTPADPQAVDTAAALGIELSTHRARRLQPEVVGPDDLLLCFETWHATELEHALRGRGCSIRLAGAPVGPMSFHIHDPYGLGPAYFRRCFAEIRAAVRALRGKNPEIGSRL
jgi:protein-tyrosine phosphatase